MRVLAIIPALAAISLLSACIVVQPQNAGRFVGERTLVPDPAPTPTPAQPGVFNGAGNLHRLGVIPAVDN